MNISDEHEDKCPCRRFIVGALLALETKDADARVNFGDDTAYVNIKLS